MKLSQLNKESLQNLYLENKRYSLPIFAVAISLLLFFTFITPQVLSFPARKTEIDAENVKLDKIKETERILSVTDIDEVEEQLKLALSTLPKDKPFEEALNGINTAAALSNSQIAGYKFQSDEEVVVTPDKLPSLRFEVSIVGGISQAVGFVNEIYKTYPISEVESIESTGSLSTIKAAFYYKSLPVSDFLDRTALRETTLKEITLIKELSEWNQGNIGSIFEETEETASVSADDGSPF